MTHCSSKTGPTGCMLMGSYGPERGKIHYDKRRICYDSICVGKRHIKAVTLIDVYAANGCLW